MAETHPPLRASSYNIYVDLPEHPDEMLLVHGFTGAYDRVSRQVGRYVRSLGGRRARGRAAAPPPRPETVEVLSRRGYLTARSPEDEETLFTKLADHQHRWALHRPPSYVFMPTYSCNLRCPYCFQDHMRTDPAYGHLLRVMSPELVERIFEAMPELEERHGLEAPPQRRAILFFGGEPLLATSRPVVEQIMEKARSIGRASFDAISNATELDAYEDLLGPGAISRIQVTLDGPPEEHDQRRAYADGAGSFERIAANITMALERGTQINTRLNTDRDNLDLIPRLAREVQRRGWCEFKNFSIYIAPIHSANAQTDAETTMDSFELHDALDRLRDKHPEVAMVKTMDGNLHGRLRQLFENGHDPSRYFRSVFCGAQNNMYLFDALGDVYACWEYTGEKSLRTGRVRPDGGLEIFPEQLDAWRTRSVTSNPACRRCRFALYCGGGCTRLALRRTGEFHRGHCDAYPRRFRAAAARAYEDFVAGREQTMTEEAACDR